MDPSFITPVDIILPELTRGSNEENFYRDILWLLMEVYDGLSWRLSEMDKLCVLISTGGERRDEFWRDIGLINIRSRKAFLFPEIYSNSFSLLDMVFKANLKRLFFTQFTMMSYDTKRRLMERAINLVRFQFAWRWYMIVIGVIIACLLVGAWMGTLMSMTLMMYYS